MNPDRPSGSRGKRLEDIKREFPDLVRGLDDKVVKEALQVIGAEFELERFKESLHTVQERMAEIEIDQHEPFVKRQIKHLLSLAQLHNRDWRLISPAVIIPDDQDFLVKMEKMTDACKYQGFDPAVLLREFIVKWKAGMSRSLENFQIPYLEDGEEMSWGFTNQEAMINDVHFLVITFLNRGAVVHKILQKSHKAFVAVMRMLCGKYGIRADEQSGRKRSQPLAPTVITLPRISAVFAQMTVTLFHRGYGRSITSFPVLENTPNAIFAPMFPSVVSRLARTGSILQNIHPQLVYIAIMIDNVLHQKDKVTPLDQIWSYYLASLNSPVLLPEFRHQLCKDFDVILDDEFSLPIASARDSCKVKIREMRPHERIDDILREMDIIF